MVDPKYLDSAEAEIEKMLLNAKVDLTQLGFDLDKEQMDKDAANPHPEEVEVDETELDRLLAGGLPFCRKVKDCGCKCLGVKNEEECLPCLKPECVEIANAA